MFRYVYNSYSDSWFYFVKNVNYFSINGNQRVSVYLWKIIGYCISNWFSHKTNTGGLPNISFIKNNLEPLETYFESIVFDIAYLMFYLEINR